MATRNLGPRSEDKGDSGTDILFQWSGENQEMMNPVAFMSSINLKPVPAINAQISSCVALSDSSLNRDDGSRAD